MKQESLGQGIATTALVLSTLIGTPMLAHAESAPGAAQEVVRFGDLNLATPEGDRALLARVRSAAQNVCGPVEFIGSRAGSRAWRDCISSTVRDAILRINEASLTAYYAERLRTRWAWTVGT